MIDRLLKSHLDPVARSSQKWQLWRGLAFCWATLAIGGLCAVEATRAHGWPSAIGFFLLLAAGIAGAVMVIRHFRTRPLDYQAIARQIEKENPELHALLLTAVEQEPNAPGGQLNYLQQRVVLEALDQQRRGGWAAGMSRRHRLALLGHWAAFGCFAVILATLFPHFSISLPSGLWAGAAESNGVLVSPGDTNLERGSSFVVLARFNGRLPVSAELVVKTDNEMEQRIALTKNLDDPVFGGGLPELRNNLKYHIEFSGGRTRDFKIGVFEYPRLDHGDVTITYPSYTGTEPKFIKNTRRVSAVEGSTLDYVFYLNKPVVSAKLLSTNQSPLVLTADATNSTIYHAKIVLDQSRRYQLALLDDAGRSNKVPQEFVLEALKNRAPQLVITAPRGDQSVSALEEMNFQGDATGAYGLKSYGIAYSLGGEDTKEVQLGKDAKPGEKRTMNYTLPLESLNAQPDQVLSYYLWADDTGPDGKTRRTTTDIFFAEVKPFDQIYRQAQQAEAGGDQQNNQNNRRGGQGGGGNQQERLADLEKDIVTATFNLQRRETASKPTEKYKDDVKTIQDSQHDALDQLRDMKDQNEDPRLAQYIDSAEKSMNSASQKLGDAADKNSVTPLQPALASEQSAYQSVLKLMSREFQVQRGQRGQRGQNQRAGQRAQRQLNQLDLAQNENQYQTQRQAQAQQPQDNQQQQEQLQVANRLKELAKRQEDLNQRMRDLQAQLQEARTEQQRQEIRDQLKRLTEEQQNVLADVDELRQRMDQQDNQQQASDQGDQQQGDQQQGDQQNGQQPQSLSGQQGGNQQANNRQQQLQQQRQQLDQTRNNVQNAADQLAQNNPGQALNSGARAEQQLQDLQDQVRRMNSAQFTQEMRQMRNDADRLATTQQNLEKQLNQLADPDQRKLAETDEQKQARMDLSQQLGQQKAGVSNILDQMKDVSQRAETAEPVLSQQLYDTIRSTPDTDMGSALDTASELVRRGFVPQAVPPEGVARRNIDQLRDRVDQAAESVLGDGTEALRLAQRELDQLSQELNQAQATTGMGTNGTNRALAANQFNNGNRGGRNGQRNQGQNGQRGNGQDQTDQNGDQQGNGGQNPNADQQGDQNGQGQPDLANGNGQRPGNRAGRNGQGGRNGQRNGNGAGQPGQDQNQPDQNGDQQANGGDQNQPGDQNGQPNLANGNGNGRQVNRAGRNGQAGRNGRNGRNGNGNGNGQPGDNQDQNQPDDNNPQLANNADNQPGGLPGQGGGPRNGGNRPGRAGNGLRAGQPQDGRGNFGPGNGFDTNGVAFNQGGTNYNGGAYVGGNVGGYNGGAYYGGEYAGPLVDTNYIAWSDRLRTVEEMVTDVPDLSAQVAAIRDRARALRLAYNRNGAKPDWAQVTEQISKPLAEVRNRVDEELLKRTSKEALVPLDRDPVPSQYSERVRRYYEQLGKSE